MAVCKGPECQRESAKKGGMCDQCRADLKRMLAATREALSKTKPIRLPRMATVLR